VEGALSCGVYGIILGFLSASAYATPG